MACYPGQPALHQQQQQSSMEERAYDGHVLDQNAGFESEPLSSVPLKSHCTHAIVKWLEDTYHYEDGICLPRSTIYEHYTDFCGRNQLQPVNAASFGKIIRQQFPTLTTRRLGTRGQSKYHYYGLGIKPTSIYYTPEYLQKRENQGITKKEPEAKKPHPFYDSKVHKPSAVLPSFPDVRSLNLTNSVPLVKLHTFMVMYRAHCQRILDSVVRANFDEVENFLLHFWQGMPSHLVPVLSSELVVDLVAVCDMTLYKAIINIYITTPLQNIPDNVAQEVKRFTNSLKFWLEPALSGLPECLIEIKLKAADMLCKSFKRQKSLMHLADAARNAFKGEESLEQLESDWAGLNLQIVLAQTLYTIQPLNIPQHYLDMVPNFLAEFSCMFSDEKCSLEDFALWIEAVMETCFKDVKKGSIKTAGKIFLLTWKFFTSKVVREFTLMSAPSFGTFHLLHMLVDDYIVHTLETMLEKEQEDSHLNRINLLRHEDAMEDILVEDRLQHSSKSGSSSSASSNNGDTAVPSLLPLPPEGPISSSIKAQPFSSFAPQAGTRTGMSSQGHTSPRADNTGVIIGGSAGTDGGGVLSGQGSSISSNVVQGLENKGRKGDYSSEILPQAQYQDTSQIMGGLSMPLDSSLQGLGHNMALGSESSSPGSTETFRNLLNSPDDSGIHQQQSVIQSQQSARMRYPPMDNEQQRTIDAAGKSLSHPNLASIQSRNLPRVTQSSTTVLTHSQASIPFPASFAFSSMMGHFASPQLQPQPLSMNPTAAAVAAGGLMQGLQGVSVGGANPSMNPAVSAGGLMPGISVGGAPSMNPSATVTTGGLMQGLQGVSVGGSGGGGTGGGVNPSGLLGNTSNPTISSIMNPPISVSRSNLPAGNNPLPMPLTHPGLQNPTAAATGLPLIPGMTNMYSYPFPAQPVSSAAVRVNAPGFPSQPLYSQYLPPSLYSGGNPPQQPPVSTGNFTR